MKIQCLIVLFVENHILVLMMNMIVTNKSIINFIHQADDILRKILDDDILDDDILDDDIYSDIIIYKKTEYG
jgi:hypothetical protein